MTESRAELLLALLVERFGSDAQFRDQGVPMSETLTAAELLVEHLKCSRRSHLAWRESHGDQASMYLSAQILNAGAAFLLDALVKYVPADALAEVMAELDDLNADGALADWVEEQLHARAITDAAIKAEVAR